MKEFGATYLCDMLSHRWLGMVGEGSCGWLPGAVVKESPLCATCTGTCEVMNEVK